MTLCMSLFMDIFYKRDQYFKLWIVRILSNFVREKLTVLFSGVWASVGKPGLSHLYGCHPSLPPGIGCDQVEPVCRIRIRIGSGFCSGPVNRIRIWNPGSSSRKAKMILIKRKNWRKLWFEELSEGLEVPLKFERPLFGVMKKYIYFFIRF